MEGKNNRTARVDDQGGSVEMRRATNVTSDLLTDVPRIEREIEGAIRGRTERTHTFNRLAETRRATETQQDWEGLRFHFCILVMRHREDIQCVSSAYM